MIEKGERLEKKGELRKEKRRRRKNSEKTTDNECWEEIGEFEAKGGAGRSARQISSLEKS